ncbi:Hypothetical_protein [Hexamita inflata]|uniref:Hypothetical_protein n=1 Tax=Hexamita inflata TaxID=28002 RepID=A0AA86TIL2_9EUKA|nr:Hypothetical protein HINF_LOCUS5986 [Hexamita inflata]
MRFSYQYQVQQCDYLEQQCENNNIRFEYSETVEYADQLECRDQPEYTIQLEYEDSHPVQQYSLKKAPRAPLPQETMKTQLLIPLVKSKHTHETSSQSSIVSSGTQASECNITIEVEAQASQLRRRWEDVVPKEYQKQVRCDLEEFIDIYVENHPKSPISKIQFNLILILKAFFKRKLISRPQCEILLKKIKSLQEVQNIEDVQKHASLPAQLENKQSQSEKKKAKKRQNQIDISIDDWVCCP